MPQRLTPSGDALGKELISPDQIDRYPRFSVQALGDQAILARFLGVFDAYLQQARKAEAAPA